IWDIENDEFTDVTFIQDIKEEVGEDELKDYPHFYLNEDASMAYATVMDTGVFAYDVEKKETETLLETDSLVSIDKYTSALTADGKYLTYGSIEETGEIGFDIIF